LVAFLAPPAAFFFAAFFFFLATVTSSIKRSRRRALVHDDEALLVVAFQRKPVARPGRLVVSHTQGAWCGLAMRKNFGHLFCNL
jgi:hypothetical protein